MLWKKEGGRASGPSPDTSDEWVELVTVRSFDAPLLVADLEQHGIAARSIESFSVVTKVVTDTQILVHPSTLDAAQAVLVDRAR